MEELQAALKEIVDFMNDADCRMTEKVEKYEQTLQEMVIKVTQNRTPVQNKKRPKRVNSADDDERRPLALNSIIEESSFADSTQSAPHNGHDDSSHNTSVRPSRTAKAKATSNLKEPKLNTKMRQDGKLVEIKKERISVVPEENIENNCNTVNVTAAKIKEEKPPTKSRKNKKSNETDSDRNDSVELVPEEVEHIEIIDDDAMIMPPPKMPPVRKPTRTKIKKEPVEPEVERPKRSTRTKQKAAPKEPEEEPMVIDTTPVKVKKEKPSLAKPKSISPPPKTISPARSEKSVYEDAVDAGQSSQPKPQTPTNDFTFSVDKNGTFALDKNGTFALPDGGKLTPGMANSTFAIQNGQSPADGTFVVAGNETFNVPPAQNGTFMVQKNAPILNSSIMTEDNSDDSREIAPQPSPMIKMPIKPVSKKNELFNPCLQSPVKSRIEAFEKAAVSSPARAVFGKTTPSVKTTTTKSTYTTPVIGPRASRKAPSTANTPSYASGPSSAKSLTTSSKATKPPLSKQSSTSSREPSVERPTSALEDKKKKREEKARLAQQQREQIENQKRLAAEKLLAEKEEKHKRMLAEKEEKRRQEALKKAKMMEDAERRRIQEEQQRKREELAKLEQQQREQQELKIKETYEKNMQKQLLQQKMQKQQLQSQMQKAKATGKTFEMLMTDDSTDDECDAEKKKRAPPPEWCHREHRRIAIEAQSSMSLDVIDDFFSVAPSTPDLKEIFPGIDSRKLKRNSSAIWRTPPRYSQMPKY